MYTEKQKKLSALLCALFVLVTLFSVLFIVKEAGHDCGGEDCPVCSCIQQAQQTLKNLGAGSCSSDEIHPSVSSILLAVITLVFILPSSSPITRKVRLNH